MCLGITDHLLRPQDALFAASSSNRRVAFARVSALADISKSGEGVEHDRVKREVTFQPSTKVLADLLGFRRPGANQKVDGCRTSGRIIPIGEFVRSCCRRLGRRRVKWMMCSRDVGVAHCATRLQNREIFISGSFFGCVLRRPECVLCVSWTQDNFSTVAFDLMIIAHGHRYAIRKCISAQETSKMRPTLTPQH